MNIVFLIQDISTQGGTERTTICLSEALAARGHTIRIISFFHSQTTPAFSIPDSVQVVYLSEQNYSLEMGLWRRFQAIYRAHKLLKYHPALQDADWIISQKLLASFVAWWSGRKQQTIACEHYRYAMYNSGIRFLRSLLYKQMRHVVVLTEQDKKAYSADGIEHISVIPNMISLSPLPYQGANSTTILCVGRLEKQKGFDLLLTALSSIVQDLKGYTVSIYGEGSEKDALLAQREALGLTHIVHFHPFTQDIATVYSQAAFFVLPSRFEGFPMVLLEAMASGLPIVSFDCPEGPAVLLQHGGGILVEAENTELLAQAIRSMCTNKALREQSHQQVLNTAVTYQPAAIAQEWEQLWKNIQQDKSYHHAR